MSNIGDIGVLSTLDLLNPQFEVRSFVLRMRGSARQELKLKLQVLIPGSMYLTTGDSHGLQKGMVLVRNLDLQRRLEGVGKDLIPYDKQLFVRYRNVYEAYRAMSRINPTYKREEIPLVEGWQVDLDKLMQLAWSISTKNAGKSHVEYTAYAHQVAQPSELAENPHKQAAYAQTMRAAEVKDRTGRVNGGRLPLMLLKVDLELWKRIVEVRGIGHRMDFRALVLELFIHKMMEAVQTAQLDLKHKFRDTGVFGTGRSTKKVRAVVENLHASSAHMRTLLARPFCHVFDHVADDYESAALFLSAAASQQDPIHMQHAKTDLYRAYRSLAMIQLSWLLQEVLTTVAEVRNRGAELDVTTVNSAHEALSDVLESFDEVESFTNEPFEKDFLRPVLDRVKSELQSAIDLLLFMISVNEKHTKQVYKHLKAAVAPF